MDQDQSRWVSDVLRRSRALCAKAVELCLIARDLHEALSSHWHCPVCGSVVAQYIYRANLSKADEDTVLATRCPHGHVSTKLEAVIPPAI
jgi:hypothetical protein